MSLTHETAVRDVLANSVVDNLDSGKLLFMTTAEGAEVATIDLAATAFGASSSGTATMLGTPLSDSSATGGTIATYKMEKSDTTRIVGGSVTATGGGGDITLSSLVITATDTVTLSSFTYSASA